METPTNPLLKIADLAALAEIAHAASAQLAVDNTFASPYLQQPIGVLVGLEHINDLIADLRQALAT